MANYITADTDLIAVANAIRAMASGGITNSYSAFVNGLDSLAKVDNTSGIIKVTYPVGATVTCSDGITTLTAPDIYGTVHFGVYANTWTIRAEKDGKSWIKEVIINKNKQFMEIDIEKIIPAVGTALNDWTWDEISFIAQKSIGDTYFDIGDCKAVTLNGTVGTLSLDTTLYVYILDFNHPINKTIADNNIIFGGFKTALTGGVDVCLCDSGYGSSYANSTKYFNMNHWGSTSSSPYNTNYGGWAACDLRYDILGAIETQPSIYGSQKTTSAIGYDATQTAIDSPMTNTLMAALPSDMRSVLRLWTRWVDNKGNSSNVDANVTAIVDAGISLLAEYEIFGSRTHANTYEQNHQKQMKYYSSGNSKIKYKHNGTSTAASWWESSAYYTDASTFCFVYTDGTAYRISAFDSRGLAPAFKI